MQIQQSQTVAAESYEMTSVSSPRVLALSPSPEVAPSYSSGGTFPAIGGTFAPVAAIGGTYAHAISGNECGDLYLQQPMVS